MSKNREWMGATPLFPLGKGVNGRYLGKLDGRQELAIIIGDETSAEDLRHAWPAIDRARTRLRNYQGSDMQSVQNALMYGYQQMRDVGWSYGQIAMDINYDCLVQICRAVREQASSDAPPTVSIGLSYARHLLKTMRMKDKDIRDCLCSAVKAVEDGYAPWPLDNGPVTVSRVRAALRQWNRTLTSKQIVVKRPPQGSSVPLEPLADVNREYWQHADALLARSFPESLAKYTRVVKTKLTPHLAREHRNE